MSDDDLAALRRRLVDLRQPVRRLLSIAAILFAAGIGCLGLEQQSHAQFMGMMYNKTPAGGFQGVGNIVSGAKAHWGVIAYSAATRGQSMLLLCDPAGANCLDAATDATTGIVSSTQTRNGTACGSTIGTNACTISRLYDDSGANFCTGGPCRFDASGTGQELYFLPNASGSIPAAVCRSGRTLSHSTDFVSSQPLSWLTSASLDTSPTIGNNSIILAADISGYTGQVVGFQNNGGSLEGVYFAGTALYSGVLSTGTFYAFVAAQQASGTAGSLSVNGVQTSGTVGSQVDPSNAVGLCNNPGGTGNPDAKFIEGAAYNVDLTSSAAGLTTTMRANGGY